METQATCRLKTLESSSLISSPEKLQSHPNGLDSPSQMGSSWQYPQMEGMIVCWRSLSGLWRQLSGLWRHLLDHTCITHFMDNHLLHFYLGFAFGLAYAFY